MKVSVPTRFLGYSPMTIYDSWDEKASSDSVVIGAPGATSMVEVPSFFQEIPEGNGNNLCHVKLRNVDVYTRQTQKKLAVDGTYYTSPHSYSFRQITNRRRVITRSHRQIVLFAEVHVNNDGYKYSHFTTWAYGIQIFECIDSDPDYYGSHPIRYSVIDGNVECKPDGTAKRRTSVYGGALTKTDANWILAEMIVALGSPGHLGRDFPPPSLCDIILDSVEKSLSSCIINTPTVKQVPMWDDSCYATLPSKPLDSYLILDEWNLICQGMSTKPYAGYHLQALRQEAYLDALDHIPQLNENSLSNILELVGFIKALVIDHRIEIPESLSSLWLSYRYAYSTTKSDAEEAIEFVHRHVDDDFLRSGFSCYGSASRDILGTTVVMKCRLDVKQKELSYLEQIWTGLYRYGLTPSFYVIWDMIPYSFIVDWFIPVGDILSGYDKTRMYDRTYEFSNLWYSLSYDTADSEAAVHAYTRWTSDSPPEFNGYYTLDNKGTTSNKVIGYRILDTLSLLFR